MPKAFGLSKTQVSNVLLAGEALGYSTLDESGVPAATQHLRDSFGRWVSLKLAFYARHVRPATRDNLPEWQSFGFTVV